VSPDTATRRSGGRVAFFAAICWTSSTTYGGKDGLNGRCLLVMIHLVGPRIIKSMDVDEPVVHHPPHLRQKDTTRNDKKETYLGFWTALEKALQLIHGIEI
jgi:hypothetical protein